MKDSNICSLFVSMFGTTSLNLFAKTSCEIFWKILEKPSKFVEKPHFYTNPERLPRNQLTDKNSVYLIFKTNN